MRRSTYQKGARQLLEELRATRRRMPGTWFGLRRVLESLALAARRLRGRR